MAMAIHMLIKETIIFHRVAGKYSSVILVYSHQRLQWLCPRAHTYLYYLSSPASEDVNFEWSMYSFLTCRLWPNIHQVAIVSIIKGACFLLAVLKLNISISLGKYPTRV